MALRAMIDAAARAVCALAVLALLGLGIAEARGLTEAENTALAKIVGDFDAAMRANDFVSVVKVIPPRVIEHIAKNAGVTADELRKIAAEQTAKVLAAVNLESFRMDLGKAEHKELGNGTPYVLIPTDMVVVTQDGKLAVRAHTLALIDEDAWYLLRVSDEQQVTVLRHVYPAFAGVEFPRDSTEALKE